MAQQSATATAREREERAQAEAVARAAIEVPPCPDWCDLEPGHEYHAAAWDVAPFTFIRMHGRRIGVLEVGAFEQNTDGVVSFWEPHCDLGPADVMLGDVGEGLFSAAQLRVLTADLATAAELLEQIQASR